MTDVEVLQNYRYITTEAIALKQQQQTLESIIGDSQLEKEADKKLALACSGMEEIRNEIATMAERFEKITREIQDHRTRAIVRMYYGCGLSDEKVAELINMSCRRVNTLRNMFIQRLMSAEETRRRMVKKQKEGNDD